VFIEDKGIDKNTFACSSISLSENIPVKVGFEACQLARTCHFDRGRGMIGLLSGPSGALFHGRVRVVQRFPECFLPCEDLSQVGFRMMVHVLAGNIGEAVFGSDIGKVHGQ
jgi:hypothetical protein